MYNYECRFVRALDGDTVELDIDMGLHITVRHIVRPLAVNCPEKEGPTKAAGEAALAFTRAWFAARPALEIQTFKPRLEEKYGRYLAHIYSLYNVDDDLSTALIDSGNGVPYEGGKRELQNVRRWLREASARP